MKHSTGTDCTTSSAKLTQRRIKALAHGLSQYLCSTVSYSAIALAGVTTIVAANPVRADDYHYIGTHSLLDRWGRPASWAEGKLPGGGDRAIIADLQPVLSPLQALSVQYG